MHSKALVVLILIILIAVLVCITPKESQVLNNKAKDRAPDAKNTLNDTAKDLIGDLTDKPNETGGKTDEIAAICHESWACTSWTPAVCDSAQMQSRTCTDKNHCGTTANKPKESQACVCKPLYDNCGFWEPGVCNSSGIQTQKCRDSVCDAKKYIENTRECTCEPSWLCLDWSACSPEGSKTRECTDTLCGKDKRTEQLSCTYVPQEIPATIKIASWNIENFGKTKATDPEKMKKIAAVLNGYDIIAVQEISNIRELSDPGCPRNEGLCPGDPSCGLIRNALETYLNDAYSENYEFVFSPYVKDERYLFIYDPDTVQLVSSYLAVDPEDTLPICDTSSAGMMVRQPFIGHFRSGGFDFVLMTAHTSPAINIEELEALAYFYEQTEKEEEPDVIILGDLNADCSYLKSSDQIKLRDSSYTWIVKDNEDTTVADTDCAYDRIIFREASTDDFTGNYSIFKNITDDISDHYLIWAEFWTGKDGD